VKKIKLFRLKIDRRLSLFCKTTSEIFLKYVIKPLKLFMFFLRKHPWRIVEFMMFVIAIFTIYTYYYPDVSISITEPLKKGEVFSSYFKIENNGNSDVEDIKLTYLLNNVNIGGPTIQDFTIDKQLVDFDTNLKILRKRRTQTINVNLLETVVDFKTVKYNTLSAKLTINLTYKYWFLFNKNDSFFFYTSEMKENNIIWLPAQ
jgi:hypothetical protein